ncbi:MAG: Hpt domain-containing protein, partial [Deltaproteobacteria bacterium]|nr:Hpt domain-containing protein [Deltaproteobacteria bacterium]
MEADSILQSIIKIADDLDNVDIKDKDAWILISHELKKTVQNLPEGLPSVKDLLSLCVKGIESVSGNMVSNSLSVVDSVFEALEAVEKYFKNKEDGEQPYIYKAVKELKKNLNMEEGFYMSNDDALSLDDVAALLVQTEPDDQVELKNLGEALKKFSYDESCSALAKETIAMAAQKIEGLPDAEPSARDSIIAAIGELIEKAMNENEDKEMGISAPEMPDTGDDSAPAFEILDEAEEDEEEPVQEIEEKFDYMPEDADLELIGEFITEGLDLITNAEEALLTLENDPDDEDSVGMVFRAFHTIKGTAAFMDLTLISEMGHHAEN